MIRRLEAVSRTLTAATQASEGHFLELGELLAQMHPRAQELVERTRSIQGLAAAGGPLQQAVERMAELRAPLELQTRTLLSELSGPLGETEQAVAAAGAEERVVNHALQTLRFLQVAQRMESARLGEMDQTLSNEFKALSEEVEGEMVTLFLHISQAGQCLSQHRHALVGEGSQTQASCEELGRALQIATETAQRAITEAASMGAVLEELAGRVEQALEDCLGALQTHDIVRQRIEHVVASWVSMGHEYVKLSPEEANHSLHLMACIQESQLDEANTLMKGALATLAHTMHGLGSEVATKMQRQIQQLARGQLVSTCQALSRELPAQARTVTLLQESMRAVDPQVVHQEMEALEQGARRGSKVAQRVRRLALNAQIQASHLDVGQASGMIAAQTRLVARDCVTMMDRVQSHLARAREWARQLAELFGRIHQDSGRLEGQAIFLQVECPEEVLRVVDGLAEELQRLEGDSAWLIDTGPQVDFITSQAGQIAPELARGLALMREIREATRSFRREGDDQILRDQAVADLRASYSMQAERELLDEVVGWVSPQSVNEYDNVELF